MPYYETVIIMRPELAEGKVDGVADALEKEIEAADGRLTRRESWGLRNLAYPIAKCRRGHYRMLNYEAEPSLLAKFDQMLRVDEEVLRFMTFRTENEETESSPMLRVAPTVEPDRVPDEKPARRASADKPDGADLSEPDAPKAKKGAKADLESDGKDESETGAVDDKGEAKSNEAKAAPQEAVKKLDEKAAVEAKVSKSSKASATKSTAASKKKSTSKAEKSAEADEAKR